MKKIFISVLLLFTVAVISLITLGGNNQVKAGVGNTIAETFPDANMAQGVADQIADGDTNTVITQSMVDNTTVFFSYYFYGKNISSIEGVQTFVNLEVLDIVYNNLTSLPEDINKLTKLEYLDVGRNNITSLPESIGELSSLYYLGLNLNQNLTELPDSICNLTNLLYLNITNCKVSKLPDDIGNLNQLEFLYAYNNLFTELPASFTSLTDLTLLQLGYNHLIDLPKEQYDFIQEVYTHYGYYQYYEEATNLIGYPNGSFSFQGFPIYSQVQSFAIDGAYYYLIYPDDSFIQIYQDGKSGILTYPDGSQIDIETNLIIGDDGLVTIPGNLLTMTGEYWFALGITTNLLEGSEYYHSFEVIASTPTIELTNPNPIEIEAGTEFIDEYLATDIVDGDLTNQVVVEGEVDINTPGTYKLIYTVTNSFGNSASVERTVIVKEKAITVTPVTPTTPSITPPTTLPQSGQNLIALLGILTTVSGIGTVIIFNKKNKN